MPDNSNVYARQGTAAHSVAEECLKTGRNAEKLRNSLIAVPYKDPDGNSRVEEFVVDDDMINAVQIYLDFCRRIGSEQGARVMVEKRVSLASVHPRLAVVWGTADCIIYHKTTKTLYVIDYKHGFLLVEAEENKQLKIYALAAWATLHKELDVERVITAIVQPRPDGDPIRTAEYTAIEMLDFAADCVEAVERTEAVDAPLVPGHHCGFCPAAAVCKAFAEYGLSVAQEEFAELQPQRLTVEQCVSLLDRAEALADWLSSVRSYLHAMAQAGHAVPGHKLVPKRATRKWAASDAEVVRRLAPLVSDDDDLYKEKELLSPAQMEEVVGKKLIPRNLIVGVSSGYNLVRDRDDREPINLIPGIEFFEVPDDSDE